MWKGEVKLHFSEGNSVSANQRFFTLTEKSITQTKKLLSLFYHFISSITPLSLYSTSLHLIKYNRLGSFHLRACFRLQFFFGFLAIVGRILLICNTIFYVNVYAKTSSCAHSYILHFDISRNFLAHLDNFIC